MKTLLKLLMQQVWGLFMYGATTLFFFYKNEVYKNDRLEMS